VWQIIYESFLPQSGQVFRNVRKAIATFALNLSTLAFKPSLFIVEIEKL
jgi:hypothetical protein